MRVDQNMVFRELLYNHRGLENTVAFGHMASAPASPDLVALLQEFNLDFLFKYNVYMLANAYLIVDWLKVDIATQLIPNSRGCRKPTRTHWV